MNLISIGIGIIGIIILIVGCVLMKPCVNFWRKHRLLHLHGINVQGSVIERHLERLSNGQPWYYLTCRYTYEGRSYVADLPVWRDRYDSEEALVSMCCMPGNPEVASVLGDDFQRSEWVQRTFLAVVILLIGLFVMFGLPGVFTA